MNRRALYDDLLKAFVEYQYRLDHPMPTIEETLSVKTLRYQTDHMFRYRVDNLTAGVMQILDKHLD